MPLRSLRPCAWSRCPHSVRPPERFCPVHAAAGEARRKAERRASDRLRGTAHRRGYGAVWRELRTGFLTRHPLCGEAGCGARAVEVHHRVPRRRGGTDAESNLVGLCKAHHTGATNRERARLA